MPPMGQQRLPKPQQVQLRFKIHGLQRQEIEDDTVGVVLQFVRRHAMASQSMGVGSALDPWGDLYAVQGGQYVWGT